MASWAVTGLRLALPGSEIWWAVEDRCQPVIDSPTLINRVAPARRTLWKQGRWSLAAWRDQLSFYGTLRKQRFDLGFDLHGHAKTALCLRLASPKRRIAGEAQDALARWLSPTVHHDKVHMVERQCESVSSAVPITLPDQPLLPFAHVARDPKLVTIMTGGSRPEKLIDIRLFEAVAHHLAQRGLTVRFVGGPADPLPGGGPWEDHVGSLGLLETYRTVARSGVHISGDTWTGHAAAAAGTPVLSLWRWDRYQPEVFRPYSDRGIVLDGRSKALEAHEIVAAALELSA